MNGKLPRYPDSKPFRQSETGAGFPGTTGQVMKCKFLYSRVCDCFKAFVHQQYSINAKHILSKELLGYFGGLLHVETSVVRLLGPRRRGCFPPTIFPALSRNDLSVTTRLRKRKLQL